MLLQTSLKSVPTNNTHIIFLICLTPVVVIHINIIDNPKVCIKRWREILCSFLYMRSNCANCGMYSKKILDATLMTSKSTRHAIFKKLKKTAQPVANNYHVIFFKKITLFYNTADDHIALYFIMRWITDGVTVYTRVLKVNVYIVQYYNRYNIVI